MSGSLPFGFGLPDPDGTPGDPQPFDLAALGAALQSLGQMISAGGSTQGPVQWPTVEDQARKAIVAAGDPAVAAHERASVVEAFRLADLWLDDVTTFPALAVTPEAWSRSEWLVATLPQWRLYAEPVLARMQEVIAQSMTPGEGVGEGPSASGSGLDMQAIADAMPEQFRAMLPGGALPPELAGMLGPMMQMMTQLGSVALTMQLSQAMSAVAGEVLSAGDIGIPLTMQPVVALVPGNVAVMADGLGVPIDDVRLYVALREAAVQRLFAHVPWLRARLVGAIEEFARGVRVDPSQLAEIFADVDPTNPESISEALGSGSMKPEQSAEQQAALARLQTLLALVEGWVEDVVTQAAGHRLPAASALQETIRRRRAAQGPAEKAFAGLVGMELRPKAVREATAVFAAMRGTGSIEERDSLWSHPDLLPSAADLEDPLEFVERVRASGSIG